MDITAISAALSGIKEATEIAKIIKNSKLSLEDAELKFQLSELVGSLVDAKIEIANIKEVLLEKDSIIKKLKEEALINEKILWEKPYYFLVDGNDKDGPFCQKCYDSIKKLIRLQEPGREGLWVCHECQNTFTDDNYAGISVGLI